MWAEYLKHVWMLPQARLPQLFVFFDIPLNNWVDQAETFRDGLTEFKQAYEGFSAKLV